MASYNNKKLSILYILQILKDYSDENHLLTQSDIAKKIYNIYGMGCERKSIGANIESLIDFGYDIIKLKNGCFLGSREFELSEIQFLIDAVFSSKSISSKQARDLAQKLSNLLSYNERKNYNYLYKADEIVRTNNKQIFYNIETIHSAIEQNKQISFVYNRYNIDGDLTPRSDKPYVINPYFMLNSMGTYYLVCNNDYFDEIANFRIEEITDIKILNTPVKAVTKLKGFEKGLNVSDYINNNVYMFGDSQIDVKLKIDNEYMVSQVRKWFGKNIKVQKVRDTYYGSLKTSEMSIIYWALQYCENVEIVEPLSTREKMKAIAEKIAKKYCK